MDNPWLHRRVVNYAHQGGAREAPSSTMLAFEQALAAGATAFELDVHATCDGVLVVCHDATVDRTSDGAGAIAELTWAELERLDNAHWFVPGEDAVRDRPAGDYVLRGRAPDDRRLGFTRLEELLASFPGVPLNIDIKQTAPAVHPYEARLAELLASYGRRDDVIVASFSDAAVATFSELAPGVGTAPGSALLARAGQAILSGSRPDAALLDELRRHVAVQVPPTYAGVRVVDERFVELAHELGLAVHVWTVDDPGEMRTLVGVGVDGIMTDRPGLCSTVLAELGAVWSGAPR